ncbi:acetylornithine deacetylase/succinyl-diaminopimelate desuccinylase-like protein [Kribbella sp. VKM Ac-2527]|uniref:Acetylornithine deacetylase/succinyl-diaminopimelate desuccinylase-like protein n=1 Tax=Kribbella caucasensis TaxID=2512215 RepID=A0A4R6KN62_9ACTN|nr:dipeptidase [Kribbella sp. VKM Ac-2527]TDO50785.1 acetylornithine deacetylase/succinyl-diaminopimelate desuccinylase-like protein [Kribbella sp. VKM Ac-2527]
MTDLSAAIDRVLPSVRADLEDLIRIPSVSADPARAADVQRSAEATAALFEAEGFSVRIVRAGEGAPAVIAKKAAPEGKPTVLLYAHHDVQPTGAVEEWTSEPFVPTERGDRLYARGAADDKAGIAAHLAAVRAFGNDLPVGVTLFVEGEEEIGSPTLLQLLDEYADELTADAIVIADSGNWAIGQPALTVSLRGLVDCFVEVRTLDHAVHSGLFGGAAPDALTALCRLLATLHTEHGDVAVDGLHAGRAAELDYPEDRFREESGLLDSVRLIGSGSLVDRLWTRPAIAVLAIDAPRVADASNTLVPVARAKVSLRVAPGDDAVKAMQALRNHLEQNAPWGAQVTVTEGESGQPCSINARGTAYDAARSAFATAWGVEPVDMGMGGSIPFIAEFQETFPQAAILVTGVEDPDTRAHGIDEGLHLAEFAKVCLAEALLLQNLA